MGFFAQGMLVLQEATVSGGGTDTLANNSKQLRYYTTSATVKLPPTTNMVVGQYFEIYTASGVTLTMQFQDATSFTPQSTVSPSSSLTVKLVSTGTTNGTWTVQAGASGASSGSKNYLSGVTTSQSSTPNTGNGNFETGTTTGFSLAHSALTSNFPSTVGSGGNSFSSAGGVHGGSAASGNLSITTVSSGQLAGSFSLSYASSAATTAGDMVISDAFNIDTEDQAKVLTFKAYYKVNSGAANGNFSGTSSNSFGWAIYDVTNNAWIMPAGVWNIVQSSGVGYSTGTFQTSSNGTQYQIAWFNANASGGAITMYLDDIFVGPQTAPSGPAMTDWQNYTPTYTGFGTVSTSQIQYRRVGDGIEVSGFFISGTSTAVQAQMTLPPGMTSADTTKIPSIRIGGYGERDVVDANRYPVLVSPSQAYVTFGEQGASNLWGNQINGNAFLSSGNGYSFNFWVPIQGFSSNSSMSSDTDTRVVAASYYVSTNQSPGANNQINFDTKLIDTHGAVTTGASAWKFTAPVTGDYLVSCSTNASSGTGIDFTLYKNGSKFAQIYSSSATSSDFSGSTMIALNAGDFIDIRPDATVTLNGQANPTVTQININRLSGPAVVAATETVAAGYNGTPTGTLNNTSGGNTATFPTKQVDTHAAYSAGTYTIPVSGVYRIYARTSIGGTITTNNFNWTYLSKNGSTFADGIIRAGGSVSNIDNFVQGTISCNAGDTIQVKVQTDVSGPGYNADGPFFGVERIK